MVQQCVVHSVPALCALLSLVLNTIQFFLRHASFCHYCSSEKKPRKSLTISGVWLCNVVIYILLLSGLSWIIYREKLCRVMVLFLLLLSLNWILNIFSLYLNQISKNQFAIACQGLASLLELVTVTWLVVISLTTDKIHKIPFYYWGIFIATMLWGYLCNLLWLNSLYALRQTQSQYQSLLSDEDSDRLDGEPHEIVSPEESKLLQSVLFFWFTPVLTVGSGNAIEWEDLAELPESMSSDVTRSYLQPQPVSDRSEPIVFNFIFSLVTGRCCGTTSRKEQEEEESEGSDPLLPPLHHAAPLIRAILVEGSRGSAFLLLGSIKLCTIALSFVGPLLLGQMVKLIENNPSQKDIPLGVFLACTLGLSFILSAVLNTQYSVRANVVQMKVRSALALGLFSRAIRLPLCQHSALGLSDAKLSNMQQVDVGRAGDIITAVHDLWSLPLQIVIAFVLLYLQVNVGFLAGVVIILVMIPLNRAIAVRIGTATKELMVHKDARVKLITECFRSIKSIKMSGLEDTMAARSMAHRDQELKYLSQRKYLDAWCVFLWASLPLLVPYLTFVTTVAALNRELSASEVFTTIALLNMLIFPMNAYPWIINGAVEASVSIRRLSSLLVVPAFSPRGNNSGDSSDSEEDQPSVLRLDLGVVGFIREPEIHLPLSLSPSLQLPVLSSELDDDAPLVSKSSLSTIFNGKTDAQLSSADLRPLSPASASVSSPSVISATDFLASWNRASLSGHGPQSSPGPSSRASSRNSSSSTDRLLDQRALVLEDSSFAVGPVTFPDLRPGQVLGICGAVGSGKTTLLMGLLGECYTNLSSSPLNKGSVSFCAQSPRLHAGTVRTNVCFESSYRRERYWMIMRGCCLDEDFCLFEPSLGDDIGSSYGMDEEDIGQGGSRLSGGQRLRVGIARALYSSSAVVLLDDPFAALDRKTSERLLAFVLSLAQREKRAVLLVTNEVHMLRTRPRPPSSSTGDSSSGGSIGGISAVVFLSGGRVVGSGSFEELHDSFPAFRGLIEKTVRNVVWSESMELLGGQQGDSDPDPDPAHPSGGATATAKGPISSVSVSRGLAGGLGEEEEEGGEHMGRGEIAGHVYRSYFRAAGYGVVALVLFSTLLMQASANGMSFWLAYWSDHLASISDSEFVKISSAIVAFNVLFAFIRSFSFAWGGLIAAKTEYRKLTDATLSTFLHFFETNSLGRIINRFGKDSDIIDDQLPFMLNRILAQVFTLAGALVVISLSSPLVIGVVFLVALIYYRLQLFYRRSSRDIRRLDAIYRSPVGNLLLDCLANAPTIRSQQLQRNFEQHMALAIDRSQRVTLTGAIAGQWLSMRLQLLGVLVTFSLAFVSVFNAVYRVAPVSASMLGLSLSYAFSLVANLNNLVNSVIETEQEMISVERVEEYVSLPSEFSHKDHLPAVPVPVLGAVSSVSGLSPLLISSRALSSESALALGDLPGEGEEEGEWPFDGSIVLNNVSFSYHMERRYFDRDREGGREREGKGGKAAVLGQHVHNGGWQSPFPSSPYPSSPASPPLPRRRESLFGSTEAELEEISLPFALRNISVVIPTGARVAVVGRTGSGKSSFLRTILNLNKRYRGQVSVGGRNIQEISKKVLRSHCGVISQDPFLFTGTIRANLDPRGLFSDSELVQALCKCGILETFSESSDIGILMRDVALEFQQRQEQQERQQGQGQPPGQGAEAEGFSSSLSSSEVSSVSSVAAEMLLSCVVADAASTLSQGQKQLLCVARILLGKPRFVFLDEASSSLDPASELLMYSALKNHLPPLTTVLAVSHRYDREGIRSLCSQVLELDHGRLSKYEDIFFL